jgi:hypothetical protein
MIRRSENLFRLGAIRLKIILEGWDAVGKSTLARELGRRLGWPVQWLGPAPTSRPFRWYVLGMGSVEVYSKLVRKRAELAPEELFYLELLTWDALLVHCRCTPELVARRLGPEPDGYEGALEPTEGQSYFRDLVRRCSRLPRGQRPEMDLTPGEDAALERGAVLANLGQPSTLDINVDWLAGLARGATPGPQLRGVGCTRGPRVALVGEGLFCSDPPEHRGGAVPYLLRALLSIEPRLTTDDVYLTSSDQPDLARELWQVQPRSVVPIGVQAAKCLPEIGLPCDGIEAPFKAGHEEELGRRIAELAEL